MWDCGDPIVTLPLQKLAFGLVEFLTGSVQCLSSSPNTEIQLLSLSVTHTHIRTEIYQLYIPISVLLCKLEGKVLGFGFTKNYQRLTGSRPERERERTILRVRGGNCKKWEMGKRDWSESQNQKIHFFRC